MEFVFDVGCIRREFPACTRQVGGVPVAYLDAPGGSQVPARVAQAVYDYLIFHNANESGFFGTSVETERIETDARAAAADLLGCSSEEIGFNCSSTQNNFNLAFALAKRIQKSDEIVITEMEHRCNRAPWIALGEDFGAVVKIVRVDPVTQQIDMEDLRSKLSPKTKIAAFNWASNAIGTVSDVKKMCAMAHEYGAVTVVDAVHYVPHFPVCVKDIDTDVLLCSAYKWFGPHVGVIYMKSELIEALDLYNVKADDILTGVRKFHMGTPQFELIAGVTEAVEFIASVGEKYAPFFEKELGDTAGRRRNVLAGMMAFDEYEKPLAKKLREELRKVPGVKVYGPKEGEPRTSTVSITIEGIRPSEACKILGAKGIYAWDGDFYAVELVNDTLGLRDAGGVIRFGLAPYNTEGDIDRTIQVIREIAFSKMK